MNRRCSQRLRSETCTQAFVTCVALGFHPVFLGEPSDRVLRSLTRFPTCSLNPVNAQPRNKGKSTPPTWRRWYYIGSFRSFPGSSNAILNNPPPSSSLISAILGVVIPFVLIALAAMVPEAPPPKMSTGASFFPGLPRVLVSPAQGRHIYREWRRLSLKQRQDTGRGDHGARRLAPNF